MTNPYLLAMLNFIIAGTCCVIYVCRLNGMTKATRPWVVAEYSVGTGAMLGMAVLPWTGIWPNTVLVCVSVAVLVQLIASTPAWRHDEPPPSATDMGALE